jgi:chromosome partitioning protein
VAVTPKKAPAPNRAKVPKQAVITTKAKPDGRRPEKASASRVLITLPAPSEKKVTAAAGRRTRKTVKILSCGAKGGPGKTFFCKNLAGAAAAAGYSVAVVDFDTQRTLSNWLQRRELKSPDKSPIEGFAASPRSTQDASDVLALNDYDIIFYDTPPAIDQYSEVLKRLAYESDLILVPSAVGIADTESAEGLLRVLGEWGRPTLVILNKVKRNALKTVGTAKKRLARMADLCPFEVGEYYDFLAADEVGLGATEMDTCVGKDDIEAVWTIIKRRAGLEV